MKIKIAMLLILLPAALFAVSGCGGADVAEPTLVSDVEQPVDSGDTIAPTPTEEPESAEPIYGEAKVDSVQVVMLESFPVQVNVVARGEFSDGCTEIDEITTSFDGNDFQVTITTVKPSDIACTEAMVPFEETIALEVLDLEAGQYMVTVNGIAGSFTLDVDNQVSEASEPTPEPTATPEPEAVDSRSAVITGRVWHDICAVVPGAGEEDDTPGEGCIASVDGESYQANGLLEANEQGIVGVVVSLGEGECPAAEFASTTTSEGGEFGFGGLAAGTYCVFVDALDESNSATLTPGTWTFPDANVDQVTVDLGDGESLNRVNFGWDYQFLPVPEVDIATCTNIIEFVEDVTIPDDTVFGPGESFEKVWRLRNKGTCNWTTEYSLTFANGDGIPGPDSLPLNSPVVPGQSVDLSVSLTAPDEEGTYRDNWQLSDANGNLFGVDGFIDEAFWVQIVVGIPEATPAPNSAVIGGLIWRDSCFLQNDGSPSAGCVETAEGSGIYVANGTLSNNEARIPDLAVTLAEGACPEEGALPAASIVSTIATDEDGQYRFSGLDEGTFCVAIDAFSDQNVDLLIPGDWTWPARGVGQITIILDAGEELLDVDFGWDDR